MHCSRSATRDPATASLRAACDDAPCGGARGPFYSYRYDAKVVVEFSAFLPATATVARVRFGAPPALRGVSVVEGPGGSASIRSFVVTADAAVTSPDALPLRVAYVLVDSLNPEATYRVDAAADDGAGGVVFWAPRTWSLTISTTVTDAFGSSTSCWVPNAGASVPDVSQTVSPTPGATLLLCPVVSAEQPADIGAVVSDVFNVVQQLSAGSRDYVDGGKAPAAFAAGIGALATALDAQAPAGNSTGGSTGGAGGTSNASAIVTAAVTAAVKQSTELFSTFNNYIAITQAGTFTDELRVTTVTQNVVVRCASTMKHRYLRQALERVAHGCC